jgi:hypothetical protein
VIEKKQEDLIEIKNNIEESLPLFKTLFQEQGGKPTVKLYEGTIGIRHILEDVFNSMDKIKDKTYYVYSSATVRKDVYLAMKDFTKKRIRRKIKVKTIAIGEGGNIVGFDERKWMKLSGSNMSGNLRPTYQIIYCGKVAHISLDNEENPVGIVLENKEIYDTQKLIFESNWKNL